MIVFVLMIPSLPRSSKMIGFALIVPMTMWMAPVGARMANATTAARLKLAFAFFLFITAVRMFYGVLN